MLTLPYYFRNHLIIHCDIKKVMKYRFRDIEYFTEVAERGNVGRAAEALGLSQPALSKSLRRLETSLQSKLVKRVSRGVELTAAGRELFAHAHRLRLSLDDITRSVMDISQGRSGHLRIGSGTGFALYVIAAACADVVTNAPGATFKVSPMARNAAEGAMGAPVWSTSERSPTAKV